TINVTNTMQEEQHTDFNQNSATNQQTVLSSESESNEDEITKKPRKQRKCTIKKPLIGKLSNKKPLALMLTSFACFTKSNHPRAPGYGEPFQGVKTKDAENTFTQSNLWAMIQAYKDQGVWPKNKNVPSGLTIPKLFKFIRAFERERIRIAMSPE